MFLFGPPNVEKMEARRDVEGLIRALSYRKDWVVRRAAAGALGQIGTPRAVDALIDALRDHLHEVRETAAKALDRLEWRPGRDENAAWYWSAKREWEKCVAIGTPAIEPLTSIVLKDALWNTLVRLEAAETLGQTGDARAIELLIQSLSASDVETRVIIARALFRLSQRPDISQACKEQILTALESLKRPR